MSALDWLIIVKEMSIGLKDCSVKCKITRNCKGIDKGRVLSNLAVISTLHTKMYVKVLKTYNININKNVKVTITSDIWE